VTTVNAKLSTARVNDAEAKLDAGERDDQRQTASLNMDFYIVAPGQTACQCTVVRYTAVGH
jgi:hypothetical protein